MIGEVFAEGVCGADAARACILGPSDVSGTNALSHSSSTRDPTEEVKAMVRFLAVYDKPDDPEAFDRHYREVHIPLAKQLPGLRRYTISRHPAPTRDREAYYLIAELDWDDMTNLRHAFETPEGRATADDAAKLAPKDKVRTMVYELEDALQWAP
ncbi:MAG TPA: EthD family reductase [Solirubrobacteraceae bacterium]